MYSSTLFFTLGAKWGWVVSAHVLAAVLPGKRPSTHCTGCWADPEDGLDACGKSRPPPGFDLRTEASLYRLSYPGPWNCVSGPSRAKMVSVWECEGRERQIPDSGSCYQEGTDVLNVGQKVCTTLAETRVFLRITGNGLRSY